MAFRFSQPVTLPSGIASQLYDLLDEIYQSGDYLEYPVVEFRDMLRKQAEHQPRIKEPTQ